MSETLTNATGRKRHRKRRVSVEDVLRRAQEPLTVSEIAAAAPCAPITVRRQLKELVDDGRVRRPGTLPRLTPDGRRRPGRGHFVYTLPDYLPDTLARPSG